MPGASTVILTHLLDRAKEETSARRSLCRPRRTSCLLGVVMPSRDRGMPSCRSLRRLPVLRLIIFAAAVAEISLHQRFARNVGGGNRDAGGTGGKGGKAEMV